MSLVQFFFTDRGQRASLIALLSVAALAVMALMGYLIWSGYREAIRTAETTSRNYAAIIEARLDATLRRTDAHLLELTRDLPVAALSKQAVPRYARALDAGLDLRLLNFPELAGLRISDVDGNLLYTTNRRTTTRPSNSDRDWFRQVRDGPPDSLVFSGVLIGRATGRTTVIAARALRDAQGTFRGVVSAPIELEYFQKLFRSLDLGAQGIIAIRRSDDFTQVVRWPPLDSETNKALAPGMPIRQAITAGKKEATAFTVNVDGVTRILSFRKLERYPFFVASAIGREDVLAGWRARSLAVGLSALLLLLLLASLLHRLLRAEARRAQTAIALAQGEERARLILDTSMDAVIGMNSGGLVTEWSAGAKLIFGYDGSEAMGKVLSDLIVPPALREAHNRGLKRFLETGAGSVIGRRTEITAMRADGSEFPVELSIAHIRRDSDDFFSAFVRDITERKQTEAARSNMATIVENASDAIVSRSIDGTIQTWNRAAEHMFGWSALEAIGQPITIIVPPERRGEMRPLIERVMHGETLAAVESVHRHRNGSLLNTSVTFSPNKDAAGKLVSLSFIYRDITERKRAVEMRSRLATIVETSNDAIISRDLDFRISSWNAAAERLFGYTAEEVIGRQIALIVPPDREEERNRSRALLAQGRAVIDLETVRLAKGGRRIDVSLSQSPINDERGVMAGVALIFRDIAERKRMERALREREAWFGAAFEQAAVGMALRDIDPRKPKWQRVNQKLCDILGYTREELLQLAPNDLTPPEERQTATGYNERLLRGEIESYIREKRYVHKDGHILWVRLSMSTVRGTDGRPTHVMSVTEDISERVTAETERQKSEAKFHDLFEFSPNAILMVNREGRVALANRQTEIVFGYTREELLSLSVEKLVPAAARRAHVGIREHFFSAAIPRSMGAGHPDLQAQRKDGTTFPVDISLNPIATDDGMLVVATVRDITDRKSLEVRLRQSQKMEAIGTLAGGIAHDFNNILAAISGNAELARQDVGAQHPALASLDEIRKASLRAKDLVSQILTYSRQQPQSRQPVALAPVVEEVVRLLHATLPTGVEITMTATDNTLNVLADSTQIHQVLLNLSTNAWHALEHDTGRIEISLEGITLEAGTVFSGLRPGRYAHVAVRDTGCGMDTATIERVFEPFFTTKEVGVGTGLGLSVVHGIMQTHEGVVRVESAPGRGTTVHLYFPATAAPARSATPAEPFTVPPSGSGQHVLYLDDEEALVMLVTQLLQRTGYRASGYTHAEKALAAVRADPYRFDLVVTDYNMPGMSGADVADELARIRPDLPVVITSGYITDELRQRAERAGVRHLIYKPNTVEELCEAVRNLTGKAN